MSKADTGQHSLFTESLRGRILLMLRRATLYLGTIAWIITGYTDVQHGNYINTLIVTIIFAAAIFVFFKPGIALRQRSLYLVCATYALAVASFFSTGPAGPGSLWLIGFAAVAAVLLGFRQAIVALLVSAVTILFFSIASSMQLIQWSAKDFTNIFVGLERSLDVILISVISSLPAVYLLRQMEDALRKELRANEKNRKINAQLRRLNEDLKTFDYSVSNALKTPLRQIHGYIDMLRHAEEGNGKYNRLELISKAEAKATELDALLDALLRMGRVATVDLERRWFSLSEMIRALVFQHESARSLSISLTQPEELRLHGDVALLQQVFHGIIDNACTYGAQNGSLQLRVAITEEQGKSWLSITDDGPGFASERLDALFLPFHDYHTADTFHGAGLSLSTARRIINRHDGEIKARNCDAGAQLMITLGADESWFDQTGI